MKPEDEISINQYGQGLIAGEPLTSKFGLLDLSQKRLFLNELIHLIMQSKPQEKDAETAIEESGLKQGYTPCVLLKKGVANHHLQKIADLPQNELSKSFVLLLSLFRIAYRRRFEIEKNHPHKWWYWDLSDDENIARILREE